MSTLTTIATAIAAWLAFSLIIGVWLIVRWVEENREDTSRNAQERLGHLSLDKNPAGWQPIEAEETR